METPPNKKNDDDDDDDDEGGADCEEANDVIPFIGFEWTQVGTTPDEHYGHKNVIFKFKKSDDSILILGDGQMLNQAFLNLIKNSIESIDSAKENALIDKIRSYGQVEVDIQTQNDEVCVTILDNGIGLPKNVNRLFEPYVTIKKEGTGLGLSIVKKIIEDHLGSLFLMPGRKMKGCGHFGAEAKIVFRLDGR